MSANNNIDTETGDQEVTIQMDKKTKGSVVVKRMRKADENQNRVSSFVYESILGLIWLLMVNILDIACIVIGSIFIHDCRASPGIPIVLIVNGAVSFLICCFEIFKRRVIQKRNFDPEATKKIDMNLYALNVVHFVSLIVWIILIIKATPVHDNPDDENYCHKTVYLFAYWMIVLPIIILIMTCCCGCCLACCSVSVTVNEEKTTTSTKPTTEETSKNAEEAQEFLESREQKSDK